MKISLVKLIQQSKVLSKGEERTYALMGTVEERERLSIIYGKVPNFGQCALLFFGSSFSFFGELFSLYFYYTNIY